MLNGMKDMKSLRGCCSPDMGTVLQVWCYLRDFDFEDEKKPYGDGGHLIGTKFLEKNDKD